MKVAFSNMHLMRVMGSRSRHYGFLKNNTVAGVWCLTNTFCFFILPKTMFGRYTGVSLSVCPSVGQ